MHSFSLLGQTFGGDSGYKSWVSSGLLNVLLSQCFLSSGAQLIVESYPITLPQLPFPEKAIFCYTINILVGWTFTWHSWNEDETSETPGT